MSRSPLSRKKIRNMAAKRCGFIARSTRQLQFLNDEIDNALMRVAGDCPDAFLHNPVQVDVLEGQNLSAIEKGIRTPSSLPAIINDRILELVDSDGTVLSGSWLPKIDGTWDGRMWLRVVVNNHPYILKSREWFTNAVGQDTGYFVSLEEPVPFDASSVITTVEIFQRYVYFPSDTTQVKAPGQDSGDYYPNIEVLEPHTARKNLQSLRDGVTTGHIQYMWRDHRFNMRTPKEEPDVSNHATTTWDNTKFPKGTFEFCYTYVWGRRSQTAHGESPRGIYDPLWESAPSPKATVTMTDQSTLALDIQATNIDAMLGFSHPDLVGTGWEGKSGLRIRFYVRVKSLVAGSGDARFERVETSDQFVLLAEVEPSVLVNGDYAVYTWDGVDIPDFERTLKASPGYYGYATYPFSDEDKVLDFSIRRTPESLEDDSMVVHMQPDGKEALLALISSAIHRADGDKGSAELEEQRYRNLASLLKQSYSNPGGYGIPRGMGDSYILLPEVIGT